MNKNCFSLVLVLGQLLLHGDIYAQPINRKALVQRHTVINEQADTLSSLTIGNGHFAFTADITGLQTFPEVYAKGVALGTQSEWGWHSFPDTSNYRFEETLKYYTINGRKVPYSVQLKEPERNKNAVNWFRQNPHRLQLGNIGFIILKKDGSRAGVSDIKNIHQQLDPWTGRLHSKFTVEAIPVEVITYCHQQQDAIAVQVHSPLIRMHRLQLRIRFPYPTGDFKDVAASYTEADKQASYFLSDQNGGTIRRVLDKEQYWLALRWKGHAVVKQQQQHDFSIVPEAGEEFTLVCRFSAQNKTAALPSYEATAASSEKEWTTFWKSGGAIDFAGSTDTRAFELERRIILSQYLTKVQCTGQYPPQETGLTYNSWYGKPHLEMHWWHGIHFALWGRTELLERSLGWYAKVFPKAKRIAERQGYEGIRWQKMTDNEGGESPSSVGAFLIWQQPHYIYFAELVYRAKKDIATLQQYSKQVFATADFMASYAYYDSLTQKYRLGKGVIAAQERFKAEETFNPTYELVYWYWALKTAQQWRTRLHLPPVAKWEEVTRKLSALPVQGDKYLFTESAADSYTNPEYNGDHPAVLGAFGMLPLTPLMDTARIHHTFNWIWDHWRWKDTWGWDYPMVAMTATRLGMPQKAVEALLMPVQKNKYLHNGHNYQDERLTIYLPGNGGLLAAVALMCAGYEGSRIKNPGIPLQQGWEVKWEGLQKMF